MPPAALIGAFLGVGVQVYANAVRKLPVLHSPWKHAVGGAAGAAFGAWLVKFEEKTEKELAVMLESRVEADRAHQAAVAAKG